MEAMLGKVDAIVVMPLASKAATSPLLDTSEELSLVAMPKANHFRKRPAS